MAIEVVSIIMAVLRYIPNAIKHVFNIGTTNKIRGYYLVCNQKGQPFINSPERVPNFLKIDTSIVSPKVLQVVSKDYCRTYAHAWKTWRNEITLIGKSGEGTFIYDEGAEIGVHKITVKDTDTIVVRVIDLGKADLKNRKDNEPATQVWKRIPDHDPILKTLKAML